MLRLINYPLLIVGIACSSFCLGQNYYKSAEKEYFEGDLNKSIQLFTKSIGGNQEVARSYMMRGSAKAMLKDFPGAFRDLDHSRSLDPKNYKVYYYYGRVYYFKAMYDSAIYYYTQAISRNSRDGDVYDDRAISKMLSGDYKGAISDEDQAIGIDAKTNEAYFTNRGFAKMQLGLYSEAVKDYTASLAITHGHKAYADRGYAYSQLGNYLKAVEDYTHAIALLPNDFEIYYRRGVSYKMLGEKEKACSDFKKSADLGYAPAVSEQNANCHGL